MAHAAIHIEWDEDYNPVIKQLKGKLPEGIEQQVKHLLGWVEQQPRPEEQPQEQPGQPEQQGGEPPAADDLSGAAGPMSQPPMQTKPDHSQAPDPMTAQEIEHAENELTEDEGPPPDDKTDQEGDQFTDVEATDVPYLKQDAGRAGKAPVPKAPPRIIPSGMVGHPGVQQQESNSPMAAYYRNDQERGGVSHVSGTPAVPIMDELAAHDSQENEVVPPGNEGIDISPDEAGRLLEESGVPGEPPQPEGVTDEELDKLQQMKEEILDAARRHDHTKLNELRGPFLAFKRALLEKLQPVGEEEAQEMEPGGPEEEGKPPAPGEAGHPPEAPQPGKPPTPGQSPPPPPSVGSPPQQAKDHEALPQPKPGASNVPLPYAPSPNPNPQPPTPPPQMQPRTPEEAGEEEQQVRKALDFAKTMPQWLLLWRDPLEKSKVLPHTAGHVAAHTGAPRAGHKYIRKYLKNGNWHYEYTDKEGRYHGAGKNAVHGMIRAAMAGGGEEHDITIPIHEQLLHPDSGGDAQKNNKIKDAHHAYQQTLKRMTLGMEGAKKEPEKLRWQEQGVGGKWYVLQHGPDKERAVLSEEVPEKLSDEELKNYEFKQKRPHIRLSKYIEHAEQSWDVSQGDELPAHTPFAPEWREENDNNTEKRPPMAFKDAQGDPWLVLVDRGDKFSKHRYQIKEIDKKDGGIAEGREEGYLGFGSPQGARRMVRFLLAFDEAPGDINHPKKVFDGTVPEGFSDLASPDDPIASKLNNPKQAAAYLIESGKIPYSSHTTVDNTGDKPVTMQILRPSLTNAQVKELLNHPKLKSIFSQANFRSGSQKQLSEVMDLAPALLTEALTMKRRIGSQGNSLSGYVPGTHLWGYIANALVPRGKSGGLLRKEATPKEETSYKETEHETGKLGESGKKKGVPQEEVPATALAASGEEEEVKLPPPKPTDLKFTKQIDPKHQPYVEKLRKLAGELSADHEDRHMRAFLDTLIDIWFRGDPKGHSTTSALDHRAKELFPDKTPEQIDQVGEGYLMAFRSYPGVSKIYKDVVMKMAKSLMGWEKDLEKKISLIDAVEDPQERSSLQKSQEYVEAVSLLFARKSRRIMDNAIEKCMRGANPEWAHIKQAALEDIADTTCYGGVLDSEFRPAIEDIGKRVHGHLFLKSMSSGHGLSDQDVDVLVGGWYLQLKKEPLFKGACYLLAYAQNGFEPQLMQLASDEFAKSMLGEVEEQ